MHYMKCGVLIHSVHIACRVALHKPAGSGIEHRYRIGGSEHGQQDGDEAGQE